MLTATPSLRARLFANPTKVGKQLPARKYWDDGVQWNLKQKPWEFLAQRHRKRAQLAQEILEQIADLVDEGKLSSTVNTDAVFEDFFEPIVRASQRSFNGVFALSVGTFAVGCGLIASGVFIAIDPPSSGNSTILGGIFGGAGAISALGSVYAMTIKGIGDATINHARLRVVLTGFATSLGQLRAIAEAPAPSNGEPAQTIQTAQKVNKAIQDAMSSALGLISVTITPPD